MPAYPVSGITGLPSSGTLPASGSQSGFDGPWLIESQDLTIQYVRVPHLTSSTSFVNSLSATNSRIMSVQDTGLHCIVRASYRRFREDNTTYSTSAWTQPQRFSIQAQSTDAFGNSYGTVSGTILGPRGRVVTSQPWYRRVPWTSATSATEVTQAVTVATMPFRKLQAIAGTGLAYIGADALTSLSDFQDAAVMAGSRDCFIDAFQPHPNYVSVWDYNLGGPYNTTLESQADFISFMNGIGFKLQAQYLYPLIASPDPGTGFVNASTGLTYYRPDRHDYS